MFSPCLLLRVALYDFVAKEGSQIVDASLHAISGNTTMRAALQRDSNKLPMLNDQQGEPLRWDVNSVAFVNRLKPVAMA